MAYLQRHLIARLALIVGILLGNSLVRAAQPEETPVVFRMIAIGSAVTGLSYDLAPGKPVSVAAGGSSLSIPYKSPASGVVSFYREVPSTEPGGKPRRVPVTDARLGKGGPYLVVMSSPPGSTDTSRITAIVVDDSWEAHPVKTVRVFNFSRRHAAVQLESETAELASGQSQVFAYPAKRGSVRFKVALHESDGWILRVSCPQGILPNARSTIVMTDVVPTEDVPNPVDVNITNVFDHVPREKTQGQSPTVALNGTR
ncbi:MAG: hypothetical protein ABW223_12840 [Rariglobus sp.]